MTVALRLRSEPQVRNRIPVDGGEPETALTLPEEPEVGCDPLVEGSETSWICWEGVSESDAWLIENFDPNVN